ncbi:Paraplegin [Fasciola hepatica]|uniref:Paraplegin n=1 Tax=Fasciola hepatica TaxID=6192 RepID=A0A4E0RLA6_FASHE|nr:Paraplegin [Fasciola hepatica]
MSQISLIAKLARAVPRSVSLHRYYEPSFGYLVFRPMSSRFSNPVLPRIFWNNSGKQIIPVVPPKHYLAAKYTTTGHTPSWSESPSKQDPSNEDNPGPKLPFVRWFLLLTTAGLAILVGFVLTHDTPYVLDMRKFMNLLERGEVQSVTVHPRHRYAVVRLHTALPGAENKTIIIPLYTSAEQFEQNVRKQEEIWGIPNNDRLPIVQGTPADFSSGRSPLRFIIGTIFFSAVLITTFLYFAAKRGQFRIVTSFTKQPPSTFHSDPVRSDPESSKQRTPPKESARRSRPADESDRLGSGLPFSFDPFSGIHSIKPVTTNVKFKDVAGLHASKEEVMEFVTYLKNPQKFQALGAKLPKGALLLGPPGTGKTLLVKALANEAGVPFFSMAGSEFVEVIGGLGASRIRQLFRTARANPPAIIFIDELDSLGRRRSAVDSGGRRNDGPGGGGGVSEMEQTLNQLLVEMDGMDTAEGTIVFAATNRADLLDKALLRAGRFDRHIYIDLPNLAERKELLAMYIAKYRLSPTVIQAELIDRLATWTPGMSGADIARLCNEAALIAARRNSYLEGVIRVDFDAAFERIMAGAAKKSNPLSPPERRVAAVQEAGRALVAWLLPRTGLVPIKVSIVPRTVAGGDSSGGLGFTHMVPEERRLFNTDELKDRMAVLLGGRAAEQVIFNAVSDASQRYLHAASDLAMKQVREWGLSKVIGNLSFDKDPSGNEYTMKPYSQLTQNMIEMEANQLVYTAFARCVDLLQQNRDKLQRIIDALLKNEVLTYDELRELCQASSSAPAPDPANPGTN